MTDLVFRGQNDQVCTSSFKVAEFFEKNHPDVVRAIERLRDKLQSTDFQCDAKMSSEIIFEEHFEDIPQPNGGTKQGKFFIMNKDAFTLLAMGFTGKRVLEFKIAYINEFNKMEAELKSQKPALPDLDLKVRFIEWSAKFLGVNDAGKLLMARKLAEEYGTQQYLPDYVTSKGQTHSATYLLKAHNCNISASIFNISCHSFGLIKKMERKGKGGTIHNWWALTDEGMEYGENKVSDKCPLQTQIHWYDDRFTEVLDIIRCKYDRLEDKIN